MTDNDIDPTKPQGAVNMYFRSCRDELRGKTCRKRKTCLDAFVRWCDEDDLDNLNKLTECDIQGFCEWRKNGDGDNYSEVKNITLRSNLATLRVFLEYAANIDAVEKGMRERFMLPDVGKEAKDSNVPKERVRDALDKLERFEYASRGHVIIALR